MKKKFYYILPSPLKNQPILLSYVLFKRASPYYDTHVIQFSYLKCYKIMMQALKNKKYYILLLKKIFLNCVCCDESQCISNMHTHFFWKSKQTAAVENSQQHPTNLKLYKDKQTNNPLPFFWNQSLTYYYYYWKKISQSKKKV